MREGWSFEERQRERVLCTECGKGLAKRSLVAYRQTKHGVAEGELGQEGDEEGRGNGTRTFRMAFPAKSGQRPCPVEGCSGQAAMRTEMRVHF